MAEETAVEVAETGAGGEVKSTEIPAAAPAPAAPTPVVGSAAAVSAPEEQPSSRACRRCGRDRRLPRFLRSVHFAHSICVALLCFLRSLRSRCFHSLASLRPFRFARVSPLPSLRFALLLTVRVSPLAQWQRHASLHRSRTRSLVLSGQACSSLRPWTRPCVHNRRSWPRLRYAATS